jgi:putative CocE/NonD family hydrolase
MVLASRAFGAFLKLPAALTRDVAVHRDVAVTAPDGVTLLTDLYRARPDAPLPTILIRSPYGRRNPWGIAARLFAERGYHAVVQSTRGTFGSGGQIDADREAGDGRAAADWITEQPWSNGELGTFGGSYLSFTQYALASTRPPQLKAMAVGVWGAERRAGYYPGGSFALDRALNWTYGVSQQERSRLALLGGGRKLRPALDHLPLLDADILAVGHPVGYYRDWLEHDQPGDPYWTPTDFRPLLPSLGIPVTMLAGWYDLFLPLMLADYQALRAGGQQARLRVGPWRHSSQVMFRHSLHDALDWFEVHLRHQSHEPGQPGRPVDIEVMGGGGWHQFADWPPAASTQRWHLQPGRALSPAPPAPSEPDLYRYDPAEPTPAVGGTSTGPNSGPRDNRELEARPDVLTFSTEPLDAALDVIGPVQAELYVTSSLAHTDFFARLCDVDGKGRSTNVTDGLIRLTAADQGGPVQVSSGAHPCFARNPGTGQPLATATKLQVAEQTLYHDPDHPSAVLLPVAGPAAEPPGPAAEPPGLATGPG